jgi:hypothetical protein
MADIAIGRLAPRYGTDVNVRGDYVAVEQDGNDGEGRDCVSLHVDSIDEFIALLQKAKVTIKSAAAPSTKAKT